MKKLTDLYWIMNSRGVAEPISDLLRWAKWMETHRKEWHLEDKVGSLRISTIFLGLDHNWGNGDPILWETMIFDEDRPVEVKLGSYSRVVSEDIDQWRHTFAEEAKAFHENKVKELQAKLDACHAPFQFGEKQEE